MPKSQPEPNDVILPQLPLARIYPAQINSAHLKATTGIALTSVLEIDQLIGIQVAEETGKENYAV